MANSGESKSARAAADERARIMLGATPLACSLLDSDGVLLDCNGETLRLFGLSSVSDYRERMGDLSPERQPDGSRSAERSRAYERAALETGRQSFEWTHMNAAGDIIPAEVTLVRVPWKDGFGLAAYCRDLREIREKERLMREADAYARELEIENRAALAAAEAKSQFFAAMSHEIRTPMNAIIGMGELMRTDNLDEKQRGYLADMRKMSRALLRTVNGILDISKLDAGKMEVLAADYDIRALYDNVCSMARFTMAGKPLEFRHSMSGDIPGALCGDAGKVRQIMTNLLGNAVKYTREGSVGLELSRAEKGGRAFLSIRVEDTGIGIRREDFGRLFGAFEQLDRRKNSGVAGTGLGLSITKRLAELMGGEVSFESEYGRGSSFTVLLPLVPGDPAKARADAERAGGSGSGDGIGNSADSAGSGGGIGSGGIRGAAPNAVFRGARVLVVDDNETNLAVAEGFLLRHGIRADTARSGVEAVGMARARKYDLVLMDHMMPGMDGIEATAAIRALGNGRRGELPVVALTANAMAGMRDVFLEAGMDDFISKPIDAAELNAVLLKWLPRGKLASPAAGSGESDGSGAGDGAIDGAAADAATAADAGRRAAAEAELSAIIAKLAPVEDLSVTTGLARVGGDKAVYVKILRHYCKWLGKDLGDIRVFARNRDWQGYRIRMHALKSVFANIGNQFMSDWARDLELASEAGDAGECRRQTEDFRLAMARFGKKLEIAGLMEGDGSGKRPGRAARGKALSKKLERLRAACLECDTDTACALVAELRGLTFGKDADARLSRICDLAEAYDYEEAAGECEAAIAQAESAQAARA